MMLPTSVNSRSPCLLLQFVLFAAFVRADLFSCFDVGCEDNPVSQNVQQCRINGLTAGEVGISELRTPYSQTPFTWTIAPGRIVDEDSDLPSIQKDFYLGIPQDTTADESAVSICALVFEEISWALSGAVGSNETNQDRTDDCVSSLSEECVDDIRDRLAELLREEEIDCEAMGREFASDVPSTCPRFDGTWRNATVRTFSTSNLTDSVDTSECNPTTGDDYNLQLVDSYTIHHQPRVDSMTRRFLEGFTPIVTIVSDGTSSNSTRIGSNADAQVRCLHTVSGFQNGTMPGMVASSALGRSIPNTLLLGALSAVIATILV